MAESKCFCHFGEYEVKDAKARAEIDKLKQNNNASSGGSGTNGVDGVTPRLKVDNYKLAVSYDNGITWTTISGSLKGADGEDGIDGEDGVTPLFKVFGDNLCVSYGTDSWNSLYKIPSISISDDEYWIINGVKTDFKVSGSGSGAGDANDFGLYKQTLAFNIATRDIDPSTGEYESGVNYLEPYAFLKIVFILGSSQNLIEQMGFIYKANMKFVDDNVNYSAVSFFNKLMEITTNHSFLSVTGTVFMADDPRYTYNSVDSFYYNSNGNPPEIMLSYKEGYTAADEKVFTKYIDETVILSNVRVIIEKL